jgi:hypothetical protein
VGWVNSLGDIMVGGFDHEARSVLPEITIKAKLQKDDHANPSLLILETGHIVIFYSAHNGHAMFFRVSKQPEDISAWGKGNLHLNLKGFLSLNASLLLWRNFPLLISLHPPFMSLWSCA